MTIVRLWGMPIRVSIPLAGLVIGSTVLAVQVRGARSLAVLVIGAALSVLVHELGHGAAARRLGYDVDRVEVSLVGGRAVWSGPEPDAHAALVISAAGPAASSLLAAGFAAGGQEFLAAVNLASAVVNLLPFRGLDGWVIWRAVRAR